MIAILAAAAATTFLSTPSDRPGWFVCDGIDRPVAWLVGRPGADGAALLTRLDKETGRATTVRYGIGRADPGAGQVYHALTRRGREVGNLHLVNSGMIDPPGAATTPVVAGMTVDGSAVQCRWLKATRLDGVTRRRGVAITREAGGLVYRTFDFSRPAGPPVTPDGVQRMSPPSLTLRGGSEQVLPGGGRVFRFANAPWSYVVSVTPSDRASLAVMRGGRTVQQEPFLGVTLGD